MVNGKRRSTYRRKGRRGNRTLSTRNIFNNKSSRAQANQINAMRKRISYVYRQCRPEVKLAENPVIQQYIPYDDEKPYWLYSIDMPTEGIGDDQMIGNVVNIKDVHLYLNARVDSLSDSATNPTYLIQGGVPITMDYRIILFGLKSSVEHLVPVDDILDIRNYNTSYSDYHMNAIRPFNAGASNVVKIFYDRHFSLSAQGRVSRSHVLKLKGSRIYKYTRNEFAGHSKGRLYALIVPVLNFESNLLNGTTSPIKPAGLFDCMTKFAYTDP